MGTSLRKGQAFVINNNSPYHYLGTDNLKKVWLNLAPKMGHICPYMAWERWKKFWTQSWMVCLLTAISQVGPMPMVYRGADPLADPAVQSSTWGGNSLCYPTLGRNACHRQAHQLPRLGVVNVAAGRHEPSLSQKGKQWLQLRINRIAC